MVNLMMQFSKERCTDHFRDEAIGQIKVAYRIMEYLDPDPIFLPKDLNPDIAGLFLCGSLEMAVRKIMAEVDVDINCSLATMGMIREGADLARHLIRKRQG